MVVDVTMFATMVLLDHAGPFKRNWADANVLLDIGPGYARLLRGSHSKIRLAVEISPVNRTRLAEHGIIALDPLSTLRSELAERAGTVDLALSVSCFQHCDELMVRRLLKLAGTLLRPGGAAYFENIRQRAGYVAGVTTVPNVCYPMDPERFASLAQAEALVPCQRYDMPPSEPGVPVLGYVLRFEKESQLP
jgi:SAM-dependent methyltransferase